MVVLHTLLSRITSDRALSKSVAHFAGVLPIWKLSPPYLIGSQLFPIRVREDQVKGKTEGEEAWGEGNGETDGRGCVLWTLSR